MNEIKLLSKLVNWETKSYTSGYGSYIADRLAAVQTDLYEEGWKREVMGTHVYSVNVGGGVKLYAGTTFAILDDGSGEMVEVYHIGDGISVSEARKASRRLNINQLDVFLDAMDSGLELQE